MNRHFQRDQLYCRCSVTAGNLNSPINAPTGALHPLSDAAVTLAQSRPYISESRDFLSFV